MPLKAEPEAVAVMKIRHAAEGSGAKLFHCSRILLKVVSEKEQKAVHKMFLP